MAFVYHGTPLSPRAALLTVLPGRGGCVSFYRPADLKRVIECCPHVMFDHGGFSFWMAAMRASLEWDQASRDAWWQAYYRWLEPILWHPSRWALIPDSPGAPSQINDGLLNDWPFGRAKGVPVWHMDGPIDRLGRLCERYDRVAIGWIGDPKTHPVGCDDYRRRMDDVVRFFGNQWPVIHMLRGILVGGEYPFLSCDSTSLAQNGHRHDWRDQAGLFEGYERWRGRREYADRLERIAHG